MRTPKTLKELKEHPLVTDFSDERASGDGLWIYLVKGYESNLECGIIHEHTVAGCIEKFRYIKKVQ